MSLSKLIGNSFSCIRYTWLTKDALYVCKFWKEKSISNNKMECLMMEKVWKIIIRITVIIIMLLWPQIKLKKGKKPIYKIALVPRISSFWSFQKAPDPAAATSSSGQPIPTSSNALGILQMSVLGSQGVWSQKASCWSSDACRPAICATSLSLPGKKKSRGKEGWDKRMEPIQAAVTG